MQAVADVNVLFATVIEGHAHHSTARQWWEQAAERFPNQRN
jgi:predicted nucleic acid-binding protein